MKLSAILAPLIAAGVPGDVILATVRAYEEQAESASESGKEKARERWRRWKNKQGTNVGKRLQTDTNASKQLARGEDIYSNLEISGKKEVSKKNAPAAAQTPLAELQSVLDAEHAQAVVDHRQKLRKPLTAHAARLLAKKLAQAQDANAAADAMIENGWQGFEVEWLESRKVPARSTGPPRKPNAFDAYAEIAREKGWITDEPKFVPSPNGHDQRFPAERGEPQGTVVDLRPGVVRRFRSGDL